MYKNGKYRETDKMSDLICENYPMVLVMSRFGIALGFGEKNIGEVCRQNGVDPCTFLTVVNFLTEEVAGYSLKPGDHGATYGGNPLACTAVKTVLSIFERKNIVGHVNEIAPYFTEKLEELKAEFDCVTERRGKGLMQGLVITKPIKEINDRAIEEGLLIIQAQGNVIRFVPPLIVEKEHIDQMVEKMRRILA